MISVRRIRSKKLREHQYREGCARSLDRKGVEWDKDDNVKHMWEQVKRSMVESTREVCGSMKVGGKKPKIVWWNNEVKGAVRRKETAWKGVLAVSDEETKERCMEVYREERGLKVYISKQKESK